MGNGKAKLEIKCEKFKFETEGSLEKVIEAGIAALQQHKKTIDIAY